MTTRPISTALVPWTPPVTPTEFVKAEAEKALASGTKKDEHMPILGPHFPPLLLHSIRLVDKLFSHAAFGERANRLLFSISDRLITTVDTLNEGVTDGEFSDLLDAIVHRNLETASALIDKNTRLVSFVEVSCLVQGDDKTALHVAAMRGNLEIAQLLVRKGASINSDPSCNGITPLYLAIINQREEVAKFLIENKADLEIPSRLLACLTSLGLAVYKGNLNLVKLLIEHGANVNSKNRSGESILQTALLSRKESAGEMIRLLVLNGADCACLSEASIEELRKANPIFKFEDFFDKNVEVARKAFLEKEKKDHPNAYALLGELSAQLNAIAEKKEEIE
jgi:ankyrin repeat protein